MYPNAYRTAPTAYHSDKGLMHHGAKHVEPSGSLFDPLSATAISNQPPPNPTEEAVDTAAVDRIVQQYEGNLKSTIALNNRKEVAAARLACMSAATESVPQAFLN